jgi:hypothetical protein
MNGVDGNSIGGLLHTAFGEEMTSAVGTCGSCGASTMLAELNVYQSAGTTMRCPVCHDVLLVLTQIRGLMVVDAMGLAALERPG